MVRPRTQLLILFTAAIAFVIHARAGNSSNALWAIVHEKCVPNAVTVHDPSPCASVSVEKGEERGFAILKDRRGTSHFLLIPTKRLKGIEDPALLRPESENYWAAAWDSKKFVEAALHRALPATAFVVGINSAYARSQEQLHIHLDCASPELIKELRSHISQIAAPIDGQANNSWATRITVNGADFRVRRVSGERPADAFRLLGDDLGQHLDQINHHALIYTRAQLPDGKETFVLIDGVKSFLRDGGSADNVIDRSCAIAAAKAH